ncbi:MAG: 50S ribosomal protein L4 [Actinomycetota bacterium]|nr:50S ribosomal protein L4 [Actinomycetota bacterium]
MPTIDLHTRDGQTNGSVELDATVFDAPLNVPAMHQVVVAQLAAARSATSKTKRRGEVRGGGKKPWRQKGTGRARQGSTRAPQWVGGGIAHGPSGEQNYTKRVSKSLKRVALRSALSDRARSGDVRVVDDLRFDAPRTKDAVAVLDALGVADRRVLLVLATRDEVVGKSFRNLGERRVHVLPVDQLNTYDVLVSDVVVFQRAALPHVGKGTRDDIVAVEKPASTKATRAGRPQPPPGQRKNRGNRAKRRSERAAQAATAERAPR